MIDSSHPLRLRILTGTHAGAELSLSQGKHAVGSDVSCDVVLSDWMYRWSELSIRAAGDGDVELRFDAETLPEAFGIDQAQRIGDVVIAVSRAGDERISDIALLSQLLAPIAPVVEARKGLSKWVIAGFALCIAATTAFTLHGTGSAASAKATPVTDNSPLARVRAVVGRTRFPGIRVTSEGDAVVVSGLLKDAADRQALMQQLAGVNQVLILQRYAVESDIATAITDAIAQPGLTVRHLGGGRFEIAGDITPALRQKVDLARLQADLGPLVKSLSFAEPAGASDADAEFDEFQMKQGYQFRIATDGAKYFVPEKSGPAN